MKKNDKMSTSITHTFYWSKSRINTECFTSSELKSKRNYVINTVVLYPIGIRDMVPLYRLTCWVWSCSNRLCLRWYFCMHNCIQTRICSRCSTSPRCIDNWFHILGTASCYLLLFFFYFPFKIYSFHNKLLLLQLSNGLYRINVWLRWCPKTFWWK